MADIDYDDRGDFPRITGGQVQKLIHVAGAVCSIALIAGVAVWGYRLAVRDVTGIPVIRAVEGPMRVAPASPGGEIADHQGMAVNVVAALGGTAELPQEIVLAPPPVSLSDEDMPGLTALDAAPVLPLTAQDLAPLADPEGGADPDAGLADTAFDTPVMPEPEAETPPEDAVAMALAEALADDLAPLAPLPEALQSAAVAGEPVARSIRPMARPNSGVSGAAAAEPVSAQVATGPELAPETLAAGTRLVQLGAFDSPELARGEWARISTKFGDLMSGKALVIQAAQSGGRTFYRLRAHGFDGEDDARRFCAALLAEDAACIPVAHR